MAERSAGSLGYSPLLNPFSLNWTCFTDKRQNRRTPSSSVPKAGIALVPLGGFLLSDTAVERPKTTRLALLCWPWSQDAPSQFRVYHAAAPLSSATSRTDIDQYGPSCDPICFSQSEHQRFIFSPRRSGSGASSHRAARSGAPHGSAHRVAGATSDA